MSATTPRCRVRPRRLDEPLFWALLKSALFLAASVFLCEGMLLPLDVSARVLVGQLAAQAEAQPLTSAWRDNPRPTLAVLKIDPWTFRHEFNGMQPLDRCVLKCHIEKLLELRPDLQQLGLDLDLSPTRQPALDQCTDQIVDMLKRQKDKGLQATLIIPVDKQDREESAAWREAVKDAGLAMADPRVVREFGIVRRHWKNDGRCPTLGQALAVADTAEAAASAHASAVASAAACYEPKRDLDELHTQPHATKAERFISYHALIRGAWVPGLREDQQMLRLGEQIEAVGSLPNIRRVILGADFDASDEHLTPVGPLAGVEVHAAVALQPDEKANHVIGLVIDVFFGLLCGWGVHKVWTRYFSQLLGDGHQRPTLSGQALAYGWPTLLMAAWLVLVVFLLPLGSLLVLLWWTVWINPVPMLVGMTVDAFVLGSLASAIHHAGHQVEPLPDPERSRWKNVAACLLSRLPALAWWLVLVLAAVKLFLHKSPADLLAM